MNGTHWGTRRAGDAVQIDPEDPTIAIVGLPDWYRMPDDDALGEFAGRQARRVASVRTQPDRLWHVLSIDGEILTLAICESHALGGFALAQLDEHGIARLLTLAAATRQNEQNEHGVLVYCDDEQTANELRDAMRDATLGGDHA